MGDDGRVMERRLVSAIAIWPAEVRCKPWTRLYKREEAEVSRRPFENG